ncbi:MAG: YfhO family protein [Planctomycetota bacterium]
MCSIVFFLEPFESFQEKLNQQGSEARHQQIQIALLWGFATVLLLMISCKIRAQTFLWIPCLLIATELVYYHRQILPVTDLAFYNGSCPAPLAPFSKEHFYRVSLLPHNIPAYRGYPLDPFVQSYRKWGLGNLSLLYEVYQDWGVMPTPLNLYANLRQAMTQSLQEQHSQLEKSQNLLLRRLGVKRVIQKIEDPLFGSPEDQILFDVSQPRPRFSFLFQTVSAQNQSDALKKMASFPPEVVILLEQDAVLPSLDEFPMNQANLELFASSPNEIRLRVEIPKASYLLVSDNFYTGWSAQVDGQSVALMKADLNFRLLSVPAGTHQVEMHYRPASFYGGLLISLSSWIWLGIFFWKRRKFFKI